MNTQDDLAWQREFEHVEIKQKKSKTVTFAGGHNYEVPEDTCSNKIPFNTYSVKEQDNEK